MSFVESLKLTEYFEGFFDNEEFIVDKINRNSILGI